MTIASQRPSSPEHSNRPGLRSLIYRADTHPTFLRRMFSRLATGPLTKLRTREAEDPALALLDAWAIVADVFTFYQERIANEGFLRTATERRSVLELARAIGYEFHPGVAAGACLAFTVEEPDTLKKNRIVTVPQGTKVQSIPPPGQMPQTFETSAEFTARHDWNALRPRLTQPCAPSTDPSLYLSGTSSNLNPGDLLLLVYAKQSGQIGVPARIQNIKLDQEYGHTRVEFTTELPLPENVSANDPFRVAVFRTCLGFFGCNAPDRNSLASKEKLLDHLGHDPYPNNWDDKGWEIWKDPNTNSYYADADIYFERSISGIVQGDWLVVQTTTGKLNVYQAAAVLEASRYGFGLSSRVTGLKLTGPGGSALKHAGTDKPAEFKIRETIAYVQSETLPLVEMPIREPLAKGATSLTLDQKVAGLQAGQLLALSAEPQDAPGEVVHEVLTLNSAPNPDDDFPVLVFREPLQSSYTLKTVSLNANVIRATHGETVREALGSGDGSQANQRFTLKRLPLTYITAPLADGAQSTLDVRINAVLWDEAPSLHGLTPGQKNYLVKIEDNGTTYIVFGDGQSGARLPSGQENIVATYRIGLGPEGEVPANALSLLQTRPQGIRSVTNPLPASGAAPPDDIERARAKAPLHVLAMGRLVSLRDYEYFAGAFAGIGKVQAANLWTGQARLVHLTVAGIGGNEITLESNLYRNLLEAIQSHRDPLQTVRIDPYQRRSFGLAAKVLVDSHYQATSVFGFVREALIQTFSFEPRAFGQPVTSAEIIAIIQGLPGVIAVDLDGLDFTDVPSIQPVMELNSILSAKMAVWDGKHKKSSPAELLTLDPAQITLDEMTR